MKTFFLFIKLYCLFALVFCGISFSREYNLYKDSHIGFSAGKFGLLRVQGEFKRASGSLQLEGEIIKSLQGEVVIASIFTGDMKRDAHLLEKDFFDEEHFKTGYFIMKSYEPQKHTDDGVVGKVIGDLSLHGKKREVVLDSVLQVDSSKPKLILKGKINIKDFGIKGSMMNNNKVSINIQTIWE
ncbi:YceI family protein [Helicobacter aurati]|uniref:YceI family protein n=1 Tax=Helicobacter aurati TaxID=137778 RepID=A0A3D8IXX5_9HELI|nr:YceI family protein [Helicobacter aurati]RDU69826.1 YceI family protein [Helicobacter aurati]